MTLQNNPLKDHLFRVMNKKALAAFPTMQPAERADLVTTMVRLSMNGGARSSFTLFGMKQQLAKFELRTKVIDPALQEEILQKAIALYREGCGFIASQRDVDNPGWLIREVAAGAEAVDFNDVQLAQPGNPTAGVTVVTVPAAEIMEKAQQFREANPANYDPEAANDQKMKDIEHFFPKELSHALLHQVSEEVRRSFSKLPDASQKAIFHRASLYAFAVDAFWNDEDPQRLREKIYETAQEAGVTEDMKYATDGFMRFLQGFVERIWMVSRDLFVYRSRRRFHDLGGTDGLKDISTLVLQFENSMAQMSECTSRKELRRLINELQPAGASAILQSFLLHSDEADQYPVQ